MYLIDESEKKQENIMSTDSKQEETNHSLNKQNYFKVPEGYFENLHDNIAGNIAENKTIVMKKHPNIKRIAFISGAAAIIAIILVFSLLIKKETKGIYDSALYAYAQQAITEYLEENLDEDVLVEASNADISFFDAGKLNEIISSDDTIKQNIENSFEIDTALNKNDILEYLLDENIDPETL
jgi:hypothetical protein